VVDAVAGAVVDAAPGAAVGVSSAGPRVRFAPSPTGFLHVGSARAALFNWLFARHQRGTFILRIEDTDEERGREEWVEAISTTLSWLGMEPDEGPFRQSQRLDRYTAAIDALWDGGFLYACDCTREQVLERTTERTTPGYDGFCRDRGLDRGPGRALRFRTPGTGSTVVSDVIRGDVTFPHDAIEDFVVARSSGLPLFVLSNAVDDRDMAITHVIRGEDLLSTTPKGLLLWSALDKAEQQVRPEPVFAHLPLLVNEQRKKLSKRREEVAVEAYRDQGFLPEAFRNYLALLGWSPPGDEEKVGLSVLVDAFRLEDVHRAPAFFDVRKLTHLNGEYLRELSVEEFIEACRPWVAPSGGGAGGTSGASGASGASGWRPTTPPPWPPERFDESVFAKLAPVVQERVSTLGEVPDWVDFVFLREPVIDEASWDRVMVRDPEAATILRLASEAFADTEWSSQALHEAARRVGEQVGRSLGKAQAPVRVAVTGRRVGPPLFESLVVLGRTEVLRRLDAALGRLESETSGGKDHAPDVSTG
jgi:glutamyl-tRNA synthetase